MKNKIIHYVIESLRQEPLPKRIELLEELIDIVPSTNDRAAIHRLLNAYKETEEIHNQLLLGLGSED